MNKVFIGHGQSDHGYAMLVLFNSMNKTSNEVNVCPSQPMYKLMNRELLRQLMQRTGTGSSITIRELAAACGLSHGTISNLLTGVRDEIPCDNAHALTAAIGVDVLILFTPTGRCIPAIPQADDPAGEAVSA